MSAQPGPGLRWFAERSPDYFGNYGARRCLKPPQAPFPQGVGGVFYSRFRVVARSTLRIHAHPLDGGEEAPPV
jgi:hypothetical protein